MNLSLSTLSTLANLPISAERQNGLLAQIESTLAYVTTLQEAATGDLSPTNQVTGLTNVWREDEVDESRMLPQSRVLALAPQKHKGYVMVPAVLEEI